MPELPEVETTVRGLARVLDGRVIARAVAHRADLRRALPPDLGQRLTGARVTGLSRRAKYGIIDTNRWDSLIFHLGMSGRWRIDPEMIDKHDHVVLELAADDDGPAHVLALNDARRFGTMDLVDSADIDQWRGFAELGPEPLGEGLTPAHLMARFAGRQAPVKALLLDQRVVAGLGNIYVCEALNIARIAPTTPGGQIGKARIAALVTAIRDVLERAIAAGGSTLRDYIQPDGELGYFAHQWRVYGREGQECACGGTVERLVQSGRSTFHCRKCQR